ncbi:molybdenum cofactor biosynthesis protein B [Bacillus sp. AFS041924]|uniref:MogA/MoaB family molybdenum cofactor biosynthesis protein n=1 Tax=Bacillus sp. AFS041924 TaxID=2033503 RepID=UPI000BFC95E9|nr:molybdenum cofactor biosynthesis protein B [Bacillus sp. AFS041924]PGS48464.1 molybdenum cofactor biosynthesis protein [Bacillus sp. AFS041924]
MHKHNKLAVINIAVLTVSDTRTVENDESGKLIKALLKEQKHIVLDYKITKDEIPLIDSIVRSWSEDDQVQVMIITGGTGFTKRDVTYEAISNLLDKEMQGFGELFRSLSYTEIGPKAMFSRAIAGSFNDKAIYVIPGSRNAVNLAMTKLILPTCQHFVEELNRQ